MNNLTQLSKNTVFDTPSYSQVNQFESTGIRELTLEEIDLVNGAMGVAKELAKELAKRAIKYGGKKILSPAIPLGDRVLDDNAGGETEYSEECKCSPCECDPCAYGI